MPRIVRSHLADLDVFEISSYIAQDNVAAAERLIDRFDQVLSRLAEYPELGTMRTELARVRLLLFAIFILVLILTLVLLDRFPAVAHETEFLGPFFMMLALCVSVFQFGVRCTPSSVTCRLRLGHTKFAGSSGYSSF